LTTGSTRAVETTLGLAAAWGARVDIVHAGPSDAPFEVSAILREAESRFRDAGVPCTTQITDGSADELLRRAVSRTHADLLVVARHDKRRGHEGWGGVPRRLIGHCPCALLIVAPGPAGATRIVLVATDLSASSPNVLAHADLFARTLEADLHALHAWQLPFGAHMMPNGSTSIEERLQREALARLRHQLELAHVESTPVLHVGLGAPLAATRRAIRKLQPDLVVLGSTSRPVLGEVVLGHTAARVLRSSEGGLLIVPPASVAAKLSG
jgi:hypothetical protein